MFSNGLDESSMASSINRPVACGVFRNHRVSNTVIRKRRQVAARCKTAYFSVATKKKGDFAFLMGGHCARECNLQSPPTDTQHTVNQ